MQELILKELYRLKKKNMRVSNCENSQKIFTSFIIFLLVLRKKSRKYKAREIMLI